MPASVLPFALLAKQREIESLRRLAGRIELIDLLGRLIHALQRERGATSLYLASRGTRFPTERAAARRDGAPLLARLRTRLDRELAPASHATSQILSSIAWALIDLESLDTLRERVDALAVSAPESVKAFSTVIGSLMELIFQLADGAPDPSISSMLVALVHIVQGKEEAGQERAVGAHMFAAGGFSADQQERLSYLCDAQARSLEVFANFANAEHDEWWRLRSTQPGTATFEQLRRTLCTAAVGDALDAGLSEAWFDAASARIDDLWHLQIALTLHVRRACDERIDAARQTLRDSECLMAQLRDNPPPHARALEHFFSDGGPVDGTAVHVLPERLTSATPSTLARLRSLLESQSATLAGAEVELDAARRTLFERRLVQRAKTMLMARFGMREDAAYRTLQKASMDRNRPLAEIAEAALAAPEAFAGTAATTTVTAARRTRRHAPDTPDDDAPH
ncbi:nitrate- and nitrite sensing domain-containing protein [Burkholderia cenocepacia]